MNCADCGQPIRPTREDDGISQYGGRYEFDYVHEDGNPVCDGLFTARPRASRLTDDDRFRIAEARRLAGVRPWSAEAQALARELLRQLAGRLDGHAGQAPHVHGWKVLKSEEVSNPSHGPSAFGWQTVMLLRCAECGDLDSRILAGRWSEAFEATGAEPPPV